MAIRASSAAWCARSSSSAPATGWRPSRRRSSDLATRSRSACSLASASSRAGPVLRRSSSQRADSASRPRSPLTPGTAAPGRAQPLESQLAAHPDANNSQPNIIRAAAPWREFQVPPLAEQRGAAGARCAPDGVGDDDDGLLSSGRLGSAPCRTSTSYRHRPGGERDGRRAPSFRRRGVCISDS
jgi:hypothetical protein